MNNLNAKFVLKLTGFVLAVLFFVPSFMVSCSGQDINISGLKLMTGISIKSYGEKQKVVDPHIAAIVFILLPAVIAGVWFVKQLADDKLKLTICAAAAGLDLICWIVAYSKVSSAAEESYCEFSVKFGFILEILLLIIALAAAVLPIVKKKTSEDSLMGMIQGTASATAGVATATAAATSAPASDSPKKFCVHCGAQIGVAAKFCSKCGKSQEVAPAAEEVAEPVESAEPEVKVEDAKVEETVAEETKAEETTTEETKTEESAE